MSFHRNLAALNLFDIQFKKLNLLLLLALSTVTLIGQSNSEDNIVEVLLVGTSHFRTYNPKLNHDVASIKQIDVQNAKSQVELKEITDSISQFNPTKIFVEYTLPDQRRIDSLYNTFNATDYSKVKRDELDQIAFRVAKNLNHSSVWCMDYRDYIFPYAETKESAKKAGQDNLLHELDNYFKTYESKYNQLVVERNSIKEILLYLNSAEYRKWDIGLYISLLNQMGSIDDSVGAHLTSEWYKRNIHMFSHIQKMSKPGERIMILAGASHTAMFANFIENIPGFKVVELVDIL